MKNKEITLFAVYKNGNHMGNEKGIDVNDAIENYLIASSYENSLKDIEFVSQYTGKTAIKGIHFL